MDAKKIVKDLKILVIRTIICILLLFIPLIIWVLLIANSFSNVDSDSAFVFSCCPDYIDDNFGTRLNFSDGVYKLKKDECGFLDGTCKVVVSFENRPQEALDTVKKMKNYWNVSYGDIYIHTETEADDSFYRVVYDPDKSELKYTSETR